jgi:chromosome segregation and condensation protein ScpB
VKLAQKILGQKGDAASFKTSYFVANDGVRVSASSQAERPPDRLTGPALETLAIIAYRQPLTRSDMEIIRGVNVDGVLHTLEERGLIKTRGRVDAPGRPILYGTTNEFLQHFGLKSLEDLPKLKEFQEGDLDFVKNEQKSQVIDTETGELKTVDKIPDKKQELK